VPGHDEQRVVDADGQPEHRRQGRGGGGDGQAARDRDHPGQGGADAEHGGEQRDAGGEDRAEGHEQHHQGDQQPDRLGQVPATARRVAVGGAARRDLQAGRAGRLQRLLQGGQGAVGQIDLGHRVLDLAQPGSAVGRDSLGGGRGDHLRDLRCLGRGGQCGPDRGGRARVGDLLAGRGHEDDLRGRAAGRRELLVHPVEGLLRRRARDLEVVVEAAADGSGEHPDDDQDEQPGGENGTSAPVGERAQAMQEESHGDS
jgi:hypothetical protein